MMRVQNFLSKARSNKESIFFYALISIFTLAYISLVLNRFWQYEYFYIDNIWFDGAFRRLARLQPPTGHHVLLGHTNILGDHFNITFFVLAIPYFFTSSHVPTLMLAPFLYGLGGLYMYKFISLKLKYFTSKFALVLGYFLFIGVQNSFLIGFYDLHIMPLFFFAVLYYLEIQHMRKFAISVALFLLTKEVMGLYLLPIAVYVWIAKKRKTAAALAIIGVTWFLVTTKFVIPYFSGQYVYTNLTSFSSPPEIIYRFIATPDRVNSLYISSVSFGFLQYLNPVGLVAYMLDISIRFIPKFPGGFDQAYSLKFHHNSATTALAIFSSTLTLAWLEKKSRYIAIGLGIFVITYNLYALRFANSRGPLMLALNPTFYKNSNNFSFMDSAVSKLPQNAGRIMAANNIAYHATPYGEVWLLTDNKSRPTTTAQYTFDYVSPDYVIYDTRAGQNPNNYFPLTLSELETFATYLINSKRYSIYWHSGEQFILKKN